MCHLYATSGKVISPPVYTDLPSMGRGFFKVRSWWLCASQLVELVDVRVEFGMGARPRGTAEKLVCLSTIHLVDRCRIIQI